MLSIAKGYDTAYLTGAVSAGREGYYTGAVAAGEPAGLWYGAGADELGLAGEVDAGLMEAVYGSLLDPRDPAAHDRASWSEAAPLAVGHRHYRCADDIYTDLLGREVGAGPERRAELRAQAERSARQAVSFYDVTFSAPKSVSVVGVAFERMANDARAAGDLEAAEAWGALTKTVEDAVLAGSRAAVDYLQDVAGYSRVGHHGGGAGRWTDAHAFVVAQFLQHDSRDRDPQLHVHQAILNRVRCADGVWRSVDSRALHAHRGAAGAIAERVMEAYLDQAVGVWFEARPDGRSREIVGVSQEMRDRFSSRRCAIGPKAEQLTAAFRERYGREPSPPELREIFQQATLATRTAKSHQGETHEQRLERWTALAEALTVGGLTQVAHDVLGLADRRPEVAAWSQRDVIERALARVAESKATWSRSDLMRALSDQLPGRLGLGPEDIRSLLEGLTDQALTSAVLVSIEESTEDTPGELVLADGRSALSAPGCERYATKGQIVAERTLRAAAVERGAAAVSVEMADAVIARFSECGHALGQDQAAAVRGVLTSGARVEVITAAAGTGKSFVVGALAEAWAQSGRRLFGLTTAQNAANVLTAEGVTSSNITRWLGAQQRLAAGRPVGDDAVFALRAGDIVTVDEASMVATGHLAQIHRVCRAADVKLLLVGDPHQLAAVGPGGALVDIAQRGLNYQLSEVRRFRAEWERGASLRLREGDASVLGVYARHGRLVEGGTAEQTEAAAARAWLADTLGGQESLLLVPSNAQADRVCAALRAELVRLGKVTEDGVPLGLQGTTAGVGDLIQARRNGWELLGFEGNTAAPVNRATYRVTGLREDGGLIVAPVQRDLDGVERLGESLRLPGGYVSQHVALAYASTVHAAEGRTVGTCHGVAGPGVNAAALYVMSSRGRERNTLWTVTTPVASDAPPGAGAEVVSRTAHAVLADILQGAEQEMSAVAQREQAEIDVLSVLRHGDRLIMGIGLATTGRTAVTLDRLVAQGVLDAHDRTRLAADEALGSLEQLVRTAELAGHDPDTVLAHAVASRDFDGVRSVAQTLHARISTTLKGQLTPTVTSHADLIPREVPAQWRPWLDKHAADADARRRELGSQVAQSVPQWAREALGPLPQDPGQRAEWEHKAGYVAAYRELTGYDSEADPLGFAPGAGMPEKQALWRAAHAALDMPDALVEEQQLTEGQLRLRLRAYHRETTWAPRYVAEELEATRAHEQRLRHDATLWAAHADAATDPTQAQQLRAAAAQAHAEAEVLKHQADDLDAADIARGAWYTATAVTRELARRASIELSARGVDLTNPEDLTTAPDWLAAHRAEQATEDLHREIHDEFELDTTDLDERPPVDTERALETAVPDIREISVADTTEHTDPTQRYRVPTVDHAAASVTRAKTALTELHTRHEYDQAHELEDTHHEPTRWADHDRTTTQHDGEALEC